jgi:signal recognition particle subunit SRP54
MLVGLQGSGKTHTCGKLAKFLKNQRRRPLLVPADVYRPAAIQQLKTLGTQLSLEVFDSRADQDPVDICREALRYAHIFRFRHGHFR